MERRFWSSEDIKRDAERKGSHWFSPGAMRFFASRIMSAAHEGPGGVFFVSSERFIGTSERGPRRYTVRQYNPETGQVSTAGGFQGFKTARAADKAACKLAEGGAA